MKELSKYTIEYKRTVRVRQYETLTIGWTEDFVKGQDDAMLSFEFVKDTVNYLIDMEFSELTKKEK